VSNPDAPSVSMFKEDARPILPIADETVWDQAVALRDSFVDSIVDMLGAENLSAEILKSEPGNYPVWLRIEAWTPAGADWSAGMQRCELDLTVEARPFSRHKLVCSVRATRGRRVLAVAELPRFSRGDAVEWARYTVGRGSEPSTYQPFSDVLRSVPSQFFPPVDRRHNPFEKQFRPKLVDRMFLLAVAACLLFIFALMFRRLFEPIALASAVGTMVLFVLMLMRARNFRRLDWVTPRPRDGPRRLGHVDGWHAVLVGLGDDSGRLETSLIESLGRTAGGLLAIRREPYGYRKPNGYEERERLVVSRDQGHVHVHFHRMGDDLFVGWQAHLNWAQWSETAPVTYVHASSGVTAFRDIRPSWRYPDEFDLIDLNSLSAVLHGSLELEIKKVLAARFSDQEVDFEVFRGDRANALDAHKAWPDRDNKRGRISNVIFGWRDVRRTSLGEMQLAPIGANSDSHARGLAAVPAILLMPILAALGYYLLYSTRSEGLYPVRLQLQPNVPYVFPTLFHLPFAIVLALGLLLYARIKLIQAALVVAVVEATALFVGYAYSFLFFKIFSLQDFSSPPVAIAYTAGASALIGICYLLSALIWAPTLLRGGRWAIAIALWVFLALASNVLLNAFGPAGSQRILFIEMMSSFSRVFMAGCFGWWLWRDDRTPKAARVARTSPARRTAKPIRSLPILDVRLSVPGFVILASTIVLLGVDAITKSSPGTVVEILIGGLYSGIIYAVVALGVAFVFLQRGIVNFAHGAMFMMGAVGAGLIGRSIGASYWIALVIVPLCVAVLAILIESYLLNAAYGLDKIYGISATFGLALIIEAVFRAAAGPSPISLLIPAGLAGGVDFLNLQLPIYRLWSVALGSLVCFAAWSVFVRFGSRTTFAYGLLAGLAALVGVIAAPISGASTSMGSEVLPDAFAVVIIAGTAAPGGVVVVGLLIGVLTSLASISIGAESESLVPFVVMGVVLAFRSAGAILALAKTEGHRFKAAAGQGGGGVQAFLVVATLIAIAPFFFSQFGQVFLSLMMFSMCSALFACSLYLLRSKTGIVSMGHAVFFAVGAYVAILASNAGLPPEIATLSGALAAAALALVAGALMSGNGPGYGVLITAALGQLTYLSLASSPIAGGENGEALSGNMLFGAFPLEDQSAMYIWVSVIFLVGFLIFCLAARSSLGLTSTSRAGTWGNASLRSQLAVFALSGAMAGLAGALEAFVTAFVYPDFASPLRSAEGVLALLLGGVGTVFGPVVGAVLYVFGSEFLFSAFPGWALGIVGVAFVCVLALPSGGVVGAINAVFRRVGSDRFRSAENRK
jgi:branched-chain amino acid transport system permease protein